MSNSTLEVISLVTVVKVCKACGGFDHHANGRCKPCTKASKAKWVTANQEKLKAAGLVYYQKNKEKIKLSSAAWRADNPEKAVAAAASWYQRNHEKAKVTALKWRKENPAKMKGYRDAWIQRPGNKEKAIASSTRNQDKDRNRIVSAKWRLANLGRKNATTKAWADANKEAIRVHHQNRRARKKLSGGRLSRGLSEKLFVLQKGKCPCCNESLGKNFHLDHITPLARGGLNVDANMQLLRATCNMQKSASDPVDFMQRRGFLL